MFINALITIFKLLKHKHSRLCTSIFVQAYKSIPYIDSKFLLMIPFFLLNYNAGEPARTVGWRDPGFIHTSFLKELWPNTMYVYFIIKSPLVFPIK